MKIAVGNDHAGFPLRETVISKIKALGHEVLDCGTTVPQRVDYPDFGVAAAKAVADGTCEKGIVVCTTGIGISIAANKVKGIRAAVVSNEFCAEMTRRHNNANILCMGGRVSTEEEAVKYAHIFINTPFEGGRHNRRVDMITAIENETYII